MFMAIHVITLVSVLFISQADRDQPKPSSTQEWNTKNLVLPHDGDLKYTLVSHMTGTMIGMEIKGECQASVEEHVASNKDTTESKLVFADVKCEGNSGFTQFVAGTFEAKKGRIFHTTTDMHGNVLSSSGRDEPSSVESLNLPSRTLKAGDTWEGISRFAKKEYVIKYRLEAFEKVMNFDSARVHYAFSVSDEASGITAEHSGTKWLTLKDCSVIKEDEVELDKSRDGRLNVRAESSTVRVPPAK